MVRPWHATVVMTLPCENGKPVRVTLEVRKVNGSDVRGSMKTRPFVRSPVRRASWRSRSATKGAPAYFSMRTQKPSGKCLR